MGAGVVACLGVTLLAKRLGIVDDEGVPYRYWWPTIKYIPWLVWQIVLSSIGFMLHHIIILNVFFAGHFWTLVAPLSLCVACGGGTWAWIYARSESIYAPWLCHALIDAAIMGLGFVMLEGYW